MNDILLNTSNDIDVLLGDFNVNNSFLQNQKRIVQDNKNDWKQFPQMGVGIENFLDDESPEDMFREIREQLLMDGQTVQTLGITSNGQIAITAK